MSQQEDRDLTNLNWVSGLPLPVNFSVSPPGNSSSRALPSCSSLAIGTPAQDKATPTSRPPPRNNTPTPKKLCDKASDGNGHKRPECSYTCLIALALASSENGHLPVNEIYKYIESRFPYFQAAPDGWKNSIRHNLSLNSCFRKVNRTDGWQGKKGFSWEVTPDKSNVVQVELDKFQKLGEGRSEKASKKSDSQIPSSLYAKNIPSMPKASNSKCSTSATAQQKKKGMAQNLSEDVVGKRRSESLKSETPVPRKKRKRRQKRVFPVPVTWPVFDTRNIPSEFVGLEAPSTDSRNVARDLFGFELSQHYPRLLPYSPHGYLGYDGSIIPMCTTSYSPYGVFPPVMGNSPSPILSMSPPTPLMTSPVEQMQNQFYAASPYYTPVVYASPNDGASLSGHNAVYVTPSPGAVFNSCDATPSSVLARRLMHTPGSLGGRKKKKSSSVNLEDLLDIINEEQFDVEDPLQLKQKQRKQLKKGKQSSKATTKTSLSKPAKATLTKAGQKSKCAKRGSKALSKSNASCSLSIGQSSSSVMNNSNTGIKMRSTKEKPKTITEDDSDDSLNICLESQPTLQLSSDHTKIYSGSVFPSDILSTLFNEDSSVEEGNNKSPDKTAHTAAISLQGISPEEKNHLLRNVAGSIEIDSLISKGFSYQQRSPEVITNDSLSQAQNDNSANGKSPADSFEYATTEFQYCEESDSLQDNFRQFCSQINRTTPSTAVHEPSKEYYGSQGSYSLRQSISAMDSVYDETMSDSESMDIVGEITVESLQGDIESSHSGCQQVEGEGFCVK